MLQPLLPATSGTMKLGAGRLPLILHILCAHAGHVHAAHELGAIQTLLITDSLFRINNVLQRQKCATLVEEVESGGGEVFVFSGVHVLTRRPHWCVYNTVLYICVLQLCAGAIVAEEAWVWLLCRHARDRGAVGPADRAGSHPALSAARP